MRALAAAALLTVAAAALAQEQVFVREDGGRQICTVQIANFCGTRPGGVGFVHVAADNLDDRPHAVVIEAASPPWSGGDVRVRRSVALGPRERARLFLPRPNSPYGSFQFDVTIDGRTERAHMTTTTSPGPLGLLIGDRADQQAWALQVMQAMRNATGEAPTVVQARAEHLHADWRNYTAFDAIVVDGRCHVPADTQEALRRLAFAGGFVLVGDPERLPAGPLRELALAPAAGRHGLGWCVGVPGDGGATAAMRERLAALPSMQSAGWPMPDSLLEARPIPGLGRAPALVFLFVILVFALVAGPVNFLLLRKWKRPLLVLATVPALGFGTTVVMLGYGFVNDGLGVRGVQRTCTLIDQSRHEGAVIAARTLFCGLSPSVLSTTPDSLLIAPHAFSHPDSRDPDRWHLDGDDERLDGGVLPSRRETPLITAQQGVLRERLRVRQVGTDRLEVLGDGGVAPAGEILLRDFDGTYWAGEAAGLRRVSAEDADRAKEKWLMAAAVAPRSVPEWERRRGTGETQEVTSLHETIARFLVDDMLPAGSYLTTVREAPWLDLHGLAPAFDESRHFVVGRFAPEDFVR